jgi:hypothetical protein
MDTLLTIPGLSKPILGHHTTILIPMCKTVLFWLSNGFCTKLFRKRRDRKKERGITGREKEWES